MLLCEIKKLLQAEILSERDCSNIDVQIVHASDLISGVLASCSQRALWITGLLDHQTINTAVLFCLTGVIFVENRRPPSSIIQAANEDEIPVMVTPLSMFEVCGLLYSKGLKSAKR